MNTSDLAINKSNNCGGRCLLEMQKTLDAQVIAEFLETMRDFYNDDESAKQIKNIIISETNEIVDLINKKASDLCSFIDEVFLHRRQRQSSFYKLCHKLARKATQEGSNLPDESKCICFSEENLRAYNVDSDDDSKMKLIFNIDAVKQSVEQICGNLLCTKCKRSSTFGSAKYSMYPDCNCTVPTYSSQHKIHDAILDVCMNKDQKLCGDSWYLTHLKRDADYYRQKASNSSISSNNSVDSFEIISPDDIHLENDVIPGLCNLNSAEEKFLTEHQSALQINSELKHSHSQCVSTENICSHVSSSTDSVMSDIEFVNKLEDAPVCSTEIKSKNLSNNGPNAENVEDIKKKLSPSDIVKQSFSNYLNNNINKFNSSFLSNSKSKAEVFYTFEVCNNLKNDGIGIKKKEPMKPSAPLKRYLSDEAFIDHPLKSYFSYAASIDHPLKSYPSDALKNAFSSYFNKEDINKWLVK